MPCSVSAESPIAIYSGFQGSAAAALNLTQGAKLLESIADVFRVLVAVLLSVMTVYIITTAMIFTIGGAT